jgi:predicted RNase H-like HicB family nuclease
VKDSYVYPALLTFAADGVGVEFPDLPGCVTCGATAEEAVFMAKDALQLHLWGMEDDGDPIPEPTPISSLRVEPGQVSILVDVWMPAIRDEMANRSVNKTLTLPKWLNDLAEKRRVNFSHVLQNALKQYLGVDGTEGPRPTRVARGRHRVSGTRRAHPKL